MSKQHCCKSCHLRQLHWQLVVQFYSSLDLALCLFTIAGCTNTKYFHPVPDSFEFMLSCQAFLQLFNLRTHYLDNSAAFKADQMIVVLMLVFVLEASDAAPEISFSCQPGTADYPHRPVHGGKADSGVFLSDQMVKVVDSGVFLGLEKYVQDLFSLMAVEQAVVSKVFSEYGLC